VKGNGEGKWGGKGSKRGKGEAKRRRQRFIYKGMWGRRKGRGRKKRGEREEFCAVVIFPQEKP